MKDYEVMYIVNPLKEETLNDFVDKFNKIISDNGGVVEKSDYWGKFDDGLYMLVAFQAPPKAVKELDRVMKITEEVLRHMIIRKGE